MPKIVDHEERRGLIVAATMRVVDQVGLEGVTVRAIAREAGVSTGVLAHYFANKADILVAAHRAAFEQVANRIETLRSTTRDPVDLLCRALEEALPLDRLRLLEAQIDVSFFGLALHDSTLRAARQASYASTVLGWQELIEEVVDLGFAQPGVDSTALAVETVALIDGISVQAVLFPEEMTVARQREVIRHHVNSFTRSSVA
ncbi:TetR/AcrR family transcriptional regulator [Williamsia sterculiae]|uniref:Transcriptional regulator, TetR family n=1 Tax=Williamsia sterculiae TaxID=1344003 RepID=A0A1N7GWA3_9NOCA|nr:TetR/AcrR family transcriptional regulator [Williamsia sterculiae]SIS16718.1 transcriptional regulator, TetR family [Williamsia sterculiae]